MSASQFMNSFTGSGDRAQNGRGQGASRPIQANICIRVRGHDLSAPNGGVVHGVVVAPTFLAGDEVSMRLTNEAESLAGFRARYTPEENRKFLDKSRPTVAKLMTGFRVGKNDIEPMREGGLLMFYGCTKDMAATPENGPTVWRGQYAENYGNDASRDVIHGAARVTLENGAAGRRPRCRMDVLFYNDAVQIGSIEDLRSFYDEHMEGVRDGVEFNANSVLRLYTPDGGQVKTFWTYSARDKVRVPGSENEEPTDISVASSAATTWKEAIEEGKQARGALKMLAAALSGKYEGLESNLAGMAQKLNADLQSGALKIEAVPGCRIPIVGDSLDEVLTENTKLSRAANRCLVQTGEDAWAPGFVRMTVGTMANRPKHGGNTPHTVIVTKFTADEFAKARSIDYLATNLCKPAFTKQREEEADKNAEQAAAAGGVPESQYGTPDSADEPAAEQSHENAMAP